LGAFSLFDFKIFNCTIKEKENMCDSLSIKETVDNSDLCNISQIKLLFISDFAQLFDLSKGIPTRNNRFPEKKYTLCNLKTMEHTFDRKDVLVMEKWHKKILFLGTRLSDGINYYFPTLYFANGVTKGSSHLISLYNEKFFSENPNVLLSQAWSVAVY
jgi:hypothetical protein